MQNINLGRSKVSKLLRLNDKNPPQPFAHVFKVDPQIDELVQVIDEKERGLFGKFDPLVFPHLVTVTRPGSNSRTIGQVECK